MTPSLDTEQDRWGELERLARAATPGVRLWARDKSNQATSLMTSGAGDYVLCPQADVESYGLSVNPWIDATEDDLAFIAALDRATVLELIAEARGRSVGIGAADEPNNPMGAELLAALKTARGYVAADLSQKLFDGDEDGAAGIQADFDVIDAAITRAEASQAEGDVMCRPCSMGLRSCDCIKGAD